MAENGSALIRCRIGYPRMEMSSEVISLIELIQCDGLPCAMLSSSLLFDATTHVDRSARAQASPVGQCAMNIPYGMIIRIISLYNLCSARSLEDGWKFGWSTAGDVGPNGWRAGFASVKMPLLWFDGIAVDKVIRPGRRQVGGRRRHPRGDPAGGFARPDRGIDRLTRRRLLVRRYLSVSCFDFSGQHNTVCALRIGRRHDAGKG